MTTQEAFKDLLQQKQWYSLVGIKPNHSHVYRKRFEKGELTINKMEQILTKANYKPIQEKIWSRHL
jgi:hypothetical protein